MKALILNSGTGSRMGTETNNHPKCMTRLINEQTLLSRQLAQLQNAGINDIMITTGPFENNLMAHARESAPNAKLNFVKNPEYKSTNYIHSIWLGRQQLDDDILMMHGDLVFEQSVLEELLVQPGSAMVVSSTQKLSDKDFKAVIRDGVIIEVGIEFFDNALAVQPLYKLEKADWLVWLSAIEFFEEQGRRQCYAENAFNTVSGQCIIKPYDVKDGLCAEIDTLEDLTRVREALLAVQ